MSDLSHQISAGRDGWIDNLILTQDAVIAAGTDFEAVMQASVEGALRVLPQATGAIMQVREGDVLCARATAGTSASWLGGRAAVRSSFVGRSVLTGRVLVCSDTEDDPHVDRLICRQLGVRSMIAVPLMHLGTIAGALVVHSDIPGAFGDHDMHVARLLAGPLIIGLGARWAGDERRARTEADRRFEVTFAHAPVGIAHVATDGGFLLVNDQFCAIAGHGREALLSFGFEAITHPDDLASDMAHVRDLLHGKSDRYSMEKRYVRADGGLVWVQLTVSLIRDAAGAPDFFISVIEDLSEIKRARTEALVDSLTGLFNRRGLMEHLSREIDRAAHAGQGLGLVYLDLDEFKAVNDAHGHAAGDACLAAIAQTIGRHSPADATMARIGGDEFVVLLPEADARLLHRVTDRLRRAIGSVAREHNWNVSASFGGVLVAPHDIGTNAQDLIDRADRAMFEAKRTGKNRSHLAEASLG